MQWFRPGQGVWQPGSQTGLQLRPRNAIQQQPISHPVVRNTKGADAGSGVAPFGRTETAALHAAQALQNSSSSSTVGLVGSGKLARFIQQHHATFTSKGIVTQLLQRQHASGQWVQDAVAGLASVISSQDCTMLIWSIGQQRLLARC